VPHAHVHGIAAALCVLPDEGLRDQRRGAGWEAELVRVPELSVVESVEEDVGVRQPYVLLNVYIYACVCVYVCLIMYVLNKYEDPMRLACVI
jgi:hypothetical protein